MITIDRHDIIQVLGGLMSKPDLLSDIEHYSFEVSDFPYRFDKFVYSAIYNLYANGANSIHAIDIEKYLESNSEAKILLDEENGRKFLQDCEINCEVDNFNYHYKNLKKTNLIKDLQVHGYDVSKIYCENIFDDDYNEINDRFKKMSTNDIINTIKGEIAEYETKYCTNSYVEETKPSDGIDEFIDSLKIPEVGCRLQGDILNTICRGGRKGKLYLRSGASGIGKTRTLVGDACNIAYPIRYDRKEKKWISTGSAEKVLYVMTEQDPEEIITMILAYLTGYNEEIFLYGTFGEEEKDRINIAKDIMKKYKENMYFVRIPDPCSAIVKTTFRKYVLQFGVENICYDYIFSSPAMLNEYRDLKVREDVCLRLFTTTLKNLAVELDAFIITSTQVTEKEEDKKGGFKDQKNIQGSKAIANLVDFGSIMSRPTQEELELIKGFVNSFGIEPNMVTDIFKNRRGRWNVCRVWSYWDAGSLRRQDLFVTTATMKPLTDFQVVLFKPHSDFSDLEALYNTGLVEEKIKQEFYTEEGKEELFKTIQDAFGDDEKIKERLKDKTFGDLLQ